MLKISAYVFACLPPPISLPVSYPIGLVHTALGNKSLRWSPPEITIALILTEKGEVTEWVAMTWAPLDWATPNRIDIPGIATHPNLAGKTIADVEVGHDRLHLLILSHRRAGVLHGR